MVQNSSKVYLRRLSRERDLTTRNLCDYAETLLPTDLAEESILESYDVLVLQVLENITFLLTSSPSKTLSIISGWTVLPGGSRDNFHSKRLLGVHIVSLKDLQKEGLRQTQSLDRKSASFSVSASSRMQITRKFYWEDSLNKKDI